MAVFPDETEDITEIKGHISCIFELQNSKQIVNTL